MPDKPKTYQEWLIDHEQTKLKVLCDIRNRLKEIYFLLLMLPVLTVVVVKVIENVE